MTNESTAFRHVTQCSPVIGQDLLPRNLTLILKSASPVKWLIRSKGIKGQLIIAAGGENIADCRSR